ncbi:hypothetical protein OKW30_001412 [Paraburkholderia sp. Clong3]|uniref:hypothetical protein n=1 Tax=Paraburkholderia sp. Clong3 TaxID=2991061 RepID=UPI003D217D7A
MATEESTNTLRKGNNVASTAVVSVASKLPMDLTMRLYDFRERNEPVMGGGVRTYKIAEPRRGAKTFKIQGNSFPQNQGPHQQIEFGYAITRGIPKAFWEEWFEQNSEADFIVNGMIFAHVEHASTLAEAREKEKMKSNVERLDPANLPKGLSTSDMKRAT